MNDPYVTPIHVEVLFELLCAAFLTGAADAIQTQRDKRLAITPRTDKAAEYAARTAEGDYCLPPDELTEAKTFRREAEDESQIDIAVRGVSEHLESKGCPMRFLSEPEGWKLARQRGMSREEWEEFYESGEAAFAKWMWEATELL